MSDWTISTAQLAAFIPLTVLSAIGIRRFIQDRIERKGYPFPPGPTGLPFLGSALSINTQAPHETYREWQARYGEIMYTRVMGVDVVVLNTSSVATALLDKRSQIYSDRPPIATVEPYGHGSNVTFERYNEHWRLTRRIIHQTFGSGAAHTFHPIQLRKARQVILSMMDDPSIYALHYKTYTSSMVMRSVYDYDPSPQGDEMVSLIDRFLHASLPALTPEKAVLVDIFPFLLHLPAWVPGSMKREARIAHNLSVRTAEVPYQHARKRVESKEVVNPSMVSIHTAQMEEFDDTYRPQFEAALKDASVSSFMGAVETGSSFLMSFTLAMVKHSRVWKRAQADIDAFVGKDRLPEFDDRSSLPYIDAILRETLRWKPPAPLGVPHATTKSDIYNGFYIPKGATVFANHWAMSRDETRYPNAEEFIPERFLDADGMLTDDMPDFTFGFGRRKCPGQYLADESLWILMATMLATLDFNLAKDADGKDIEFEAKFRGGLSRQPLTFPCLITPRSHVNRATLERAASM